MDLSSKHIENAVEQMSSLPGIGKKTALRLVLNLLHRSDEEVLNFSQAFYEMKKNVCFCKICHNISDAEICRICDGIKRDKGLICVVQDIRNVIAIENTGQYRGVYHVLGGIISPLDGIGPSDLNIETLISRVQGGEVSELILALSTTMEGDTTNFYLYKKLKDTNVKISTLARGIAIGDELEYTDEITLGRSILQRTPFEHSLSR